MMIASPSIIVCSCQVGACFGCGGQKLLRCSDCVASIDRSACSQALSTRSPWKRLLICGTTAHGACNELLVLALQITNVSYLDRAAVVSA